MNTLNLSSFLRLRPGSQRSPRHLRGEVQRSLRTSLPQLELTFGRQCWRPARRPPASSSGQRSCLPAAPPSSCCRFFGCSPGSQTLEGNNPEARCLPGRCSAFPRLLCTCSPLNPLHTRELGCALLRLLFSLHLRVGKKKSSQQFLSFGGCARKRMIS